MAGDHVLIAPTATDRVDPSDGPVRREGRRTLTLGSRLTRLSVEQICWLVLIVLAIVSRFWDLGYRALMHDEAIHTYYSWLLYRGEGYAHDPLSHGPFLFHVNALMYFLFGDTDASSRFAPAFAGVLIVAAPWLLRGRAHLGRYGALAAGLLFLVSPSILYYTRFIRHDPYTVLGSLLLLIAIFRFIETPQRRWLILAGGMLGFLYTNHEIVFAIVAIFVGILALVLLVGPLRVLLPVVVAGAGLAIGLVGVWSASPERLGGHFPPIPWDRSGPPNLRPTPENQRQYYLDLITHPLVLCLLLVVVAMLVAAWLIIRRLTLPDARYAGPDGYARGWVEVLFANARPGSVAAGFRNAWRDKVGLQLALVLAVGICVVLYTTMFTNLGGLATGTLATDGSLLYWLGQQGVQRGEQPWFYFLVMAPQYELLALAFGIPAVALVAWRGLRVALRRTEHPPRLTFQLFLVIWAVGITVALSYAGEKMPWLIIHIMLPTILLAAGLIGELVERWVAARRMAPATTNRGSPFRYAGVAGHWVTPAIGGLLLALGGAWLLIAARLSSPRFVDVQDSVQRTLAQGVRSDWWQLAVPVIVAVGLILLSVWLAGATRAARATLAALFVGLLLLQVHAGYRLAFAQGDVARDTLIYNTTTPDVQRMMADLQYLSYEINGDMSLPIQFGDDVNWPLYWYMRDFTGSYYQAEVDANPDVPIIILPSPNRQEIDRLTAAGYTQQNYVLRWHEPEDSVYRQFAIAPELPPNRSAWGSETNPHDLPAVLGSIRDSIMTQTTIEGQQRLWRLIFYREMPTRTIDFGYAIFIRNDILPVYDQIHYDEPGR
jgi:predicted membrane-bound mannosyltransferase